MDPLEEVPDDALGLQDAEWKEDDWSAMLDRMVENGLVGWREIATTILGELNPGQVGTGIASSDATKFGFKRNHVSQHADQSFMPLVMRWFYQQSGHCLDCGTRLDLQSDHIIGREEYDDPRDADWLENMCLRCRRHNVAKRRSHKGRAGRTLLPAQQALMWILLHIQPKSLRDFARLCRLYGMTMADVRFHEAWAMAVWLNREGEYDIADEASVYDLVLWPDNAVTRRYTTPDPAPAGARTVASNVPGTSFLCLVSTTKTGQVRYFEFPLGAVPFAYDLGRRPVTDICMWPTQTGGTPLAPRGQDLHALITRAENQVALLLTDGQVERQLAPVGLGRAYYQGNRLCALPTSSLSLQVATLSSAHES